MAFKMSKRQGAFVGLVVFGLFISVSYQNCGENVAFKELQQSSESLALPSSDMSYKSCLFDGKTVSHGSSVQAFNNSSVPHGSECQAETRICTDGILSGSFQFSSCTAGAAAACLFNGKTIVSGQSVDAFLSSTTPYGQSCNTQKRNCMNGQLSGSYQYSTCAVGAPASCLFNGTTIAHGSSVNAFFQSTVSYGQNCTNENRVCNNGRLAGTASYASCVQSQAASCMFNGRTITHGASVTAYAESQVPNISSCVSQQRTCTNGSLSGSYGASTCDAAPICGSAHGALSFVQPSAGSLCRFGTPSSLQGNGTHASPWRWTCNYGSTLHQCAQNPCSKISIKVRSNSVDSVNAPFKNLNMNGFAFSIDGQFVQIGGDTNEPGINTYISNYTQFASVISSTYANNPITANRVIAVTGSEFTWMASDGSTSLRGTEVIIQGKDGQKVSFQSGGGFWTLAPAANSGFGSSVECAP